MSPLDQIRESIEARIAELTNEMAALQAARAALRDRSAVGATTIASTTRVAVAQGRRTPKRARNGHSADVAAETGTGAGANAPAATDEVAAKPTGRSPRARTRSQTKAARSERPVEVLLAGKLEAMLREAEGGLSAVAISERANAGYRQVLVLLRELESAGQVRRAGARRTSLWRLITDEERIAQRAAELASRSTTTRKTNLTAARGPQRGTAPAGQRPAGRAHRRTKPPTERS
jgi:hypothetical protein